MPGPADRDPARGELEVYRAQAQRLLDIVAADAVQAAAPGLLDDALMRAHEETKAAVIAEVRARTGLFPNIVTGVIVWVVTVGLTVILALAQPDWVRNLVEHVAAAPR